MLGLTNTATDRTYLGKEQRKSVAIDITAPARFALSLILVFALAKLLVTAHRHLPGSPWIAFAFFGQDALFAIVTGPLLALIARRFPLASWSIYLLLCVYAAFNVPLTRALSSPLTLQIWQAAGGPLADSIKHYLTATNFSLMTAVLFTGCISIPLVKRIPPHVGTPLALALLLLGACAAVVANRVETSGLDRNPVLAFVASSFPRVSPAHTSFDWRKSDLAPLADPDLSSLRGSMVDRNVIVIALESTAARYLPLFRPSACASPPGNLLRDPMPTLSALSQDALVVDNAYCVYPESIKGLFSVLCSRYPAFDTSVERLARSRAPSMAEVLGTRGYRTALFHSGRFMYLGMDSIIQNRGFDSLEDAGAISGNFNSSFGVDEPSTVQRMLGWIDIRKPGDKFLLMYLPIAGHHPYDTSQPGPFPVRTDQDRYLNSLYYGDRSLGELFTGLKQRQLLTNTLFFIYGDHGEAFGQHDGNYAHTLFLYEENIHVPLIIAAPGRLSGQTRLQNPVSLIDLTPTLLDFLGIRVPRAFQGSSLIDHQARRSLFYTDYSLPLVGLRDGPWKFIAQLGTKRTQLYDLAADPNEKTNLSLFLPDRVAGYRSRLQNWSAAQKALYRN